MSNVQKVAFSSIRNLKSFALQGEFDPMFFKHVLEHGLLHHFKHVNTPIKVWAEVSEDEDLAFVHLELKNSRGEIEQPWILTLRRCLPEDHEDLEAFELDWVALEKAEKPFMEGDFFWHCDKFTPQTISEALNVWASRFWPDWEPVWNWKKVDDHMDVLMATLQKQLDEVFLYLITPKASVTPEVLNLLEEKGFPIVLETNEGYGIHASALQVLEFKSVDELKGLRFEQLKIF